MTANPVPSLLTQMGTADIPAVYRRFADVVGARHWKHRVMQMRAAIKGNHALAHYLYNENDIAFGFQRCHDLIER